jgi:hypothetical protein
MNAAAQCLLGGVRDRGRADEPGRDPVAGVAHELRETGGRGIPHHRIGNDVEPQAVIAAATSSANPAGVGGIRRCSRYAISVAYRHDQSR